MNTNRKFRIFAAWAVAAFILAGGAAGVMQAFAAADKPELQEFYKADYPSEDSVVGAPTPNVLFFLESSTAMMFAPWGLIPTVNDAFTAQTHQTSPGHYQVLQYKANNLSNDTFGSGMRNVMFGAGNEAWTQEQWQSSAATPVSQVKSVDGGYRLVDVGISGGGSSGGGYSRMGRDLDPSNNIIGDPTCYYSVFPDKLYFLTFRNRLLAWHDWRTGPPNLATLPTGALANEHIAAQNSYNAIKNYMPGSGHSNAGKPVPLVLANVHLVPNDSRIYKLKLALWHLLNEKNGEKLSKVNVGIAQIYKSYMRSPAVWNSYVYHGHGVSSTNSNTMAVSKDWAYYGAYPTATLGTPSGSTISSPYGSGSYFIYGSTHSYPNQQSMGQMVKYDISNYGGTTNPDTDATGARSWSRALLTLPFSKLYRMEQGKPIPTEHFWHVTDLIDGIERYAATSPITDSMSKVVSTIGEPAIPNNQEIFAIGANFVATGLYGGRTTPALIGPAVSGGTTGGVFHQGRTATNDLIQYAQDNALQYPDGDIFLKKMTNSEGLHTGQATGSVIDFFNPLDGNGFSNGLKFDKDTTAGFFPVTGSCQQNWVVLFVSGNEALKSFDQQYTIAKAASKLFQNTLTMRGRKWDEKNKQWTVVDEMGMDSGVRTIIVGLVDDTKNADGITYKYPDVKNLVEDLEKAAKAGDPVLEKNGNPKNPAHWHENPNAKAYFAKDVEGITKALDEILKRITVGDMGSGLPVHVPGLEEVTADGSSSRVVFEASYMINNIDQWSAHLKKTVYEADNKADKDVPPKWDAGQMMIAQAKADSRKLYTWIDGTSGGIKSLNPTATADAATTADWHDTAGVPSNEIVHFRKWLYEFDVNDPKLSDTIKDMGVLGDIQHSNIQVVGKPKVGVPLMSAAAERASTVYIQTNRGFLHAIDYADGKERWGFVPPNIFKDRLRNLKFEEKANKLEFMDSFRSEPMFLLDGRVIVSDVRNDVRNTEINNDPYRTILIGYLGRGGNGLYAMNVTDAGAEPNFLWAIENPNYGTSNPEKTLTWGVDAPDTTTGGNYDYSELGLTIVPGAIASFADREIGLLPGGLGHRSQQLARGSVFYFFDPNTGAILKKITSADNGIDLGMGITPITRKTGSGSPIKPTVAFYTADSNGNILYCDTTVSVDRWALEKKFQLVTVDTPEKPVIIPHALIVGRSDVGHEWVFGGTMDLAGPGSRNNVERVLHNDQQFIFGLNINNLGKATPVPPATDWTTSDLEVVTYYNGDKDDELTAFPVYEEAKAYVKGIGDKSDHATKGWYLLLRPKIDGGSGRGTEQEYVSAPPYMFDGYLIVATFIPYAAEKISECVDVGIGKIYVLNPSTGVPVVEPKTLENVKVVGFAGMEGKLGISLQKLVAGANADVDIELPVTVDPTRPTPNVPHIKYWREKFQ